MSRWKCLKNKHQTYVLVFVKKRNKFSTCSYIARLISQLDNLWYIFSWSLRFIASCSYILTHWQKELQFKVMFGLVCVYIFPESHFICFSPECFSSPLMMTSILHGWPKKQKQILPSRLCLNQLFTLSALTKKKPFVWKTPILLYETTSNLVYVLW